MAFIPGEHRRSSDLNLFEKQSLTLLKAMITVLFIVFDINQCIFFIFMQSCCCICHTLASNICRFRFFNLD